MVFYFLHLYLYVNIRFLRISFFIKRIKIAIFFSDYSLLKNVYLSAKQRDNLLNDLGHPSILLYIDRS